MNVRLRRFTASIFALALICTASTLAMAKSEITPGGPWLSENQPVNLYAFSDYDELVKALKQAEKASKGLVELEIIGTTNAGRDIYLAKIGDPAKVPVMIQTQQHGNEPIGTESAIKVIKALSTGNESAMKILDELYVLLIVRVNPDGTELWQRYNDDPTAPARDTNKYIYTNYEGGIGWDINRYHFANWEDCELFAWYQADPDLYPYPENPVPEAVAVMETFLYYQPLWMVDFHGQGTYVTDDGENVTSSMLWPTNEDASGVVDLSKQLCVVMMDRMAEYEFATVNLYPGGTQPGIARNAYGIEGAGSVLVEIKGGIGQKSNGMLVKHAVEQMMAILEATADGSLFLADPDRVEELDIGRTWYYKDIPGGDGKDQPTE